MRKRYDKLDRRDENLNMNLTKNMDMLNQMRSQAQSSAAAGASPGLSAEESGSDAENAPCLEESIGGTIANAPGPEDSIGDAFLLEEHDTVCCGHDSEHAAIAEDAPDSQDQDVEDVSIADPQNDPAPETSCAEEDGSALTGADSIGMGFIVVLHWLCFHSWTVWYCEASTINFLIFQVLQLESLPLYMTEMSQVKLKR